MKKKSRQLEYTDSENKRIGIGRLRLSGTIFSVSLQLVVLVSEGLHRKEFDETGECHAHVVFWKGNKEISAGKVYFDEGGNFLRYNPSQYHYDPKLIAKVLEEAPKHGRLIVKSWCEFAEAEAARREAAGKQAIVSHTTGRKSNRRKAVTLQDHRDRKDKAWMLGEDDDRMRLPQVKFRVSRKGK